jgi:hypothetical protein
MTKANGTNVMSTDDDENAMTMTNVCRFSRHRVVWGDYRETNHIRDKLIYLPLNPSGISLDDLNLDLWDPLTYEGHDEAKFARQSNVPLISWSNLYQQQSRAIPHYPRLRRLLRLASVIGPNELPRLWKKLMMLDRLVETEARQPFPRAASTAAE